MQNMNKLNPFKLSRLSNPLQHTRIKQFIASTNIQSLDLALTQVRCNSNNVETIIDPFLIRKFPILGNVGRCN